MENLKNKEIYSGDSQSSSDDFLKVRCPQCFHSYRINTADVQVARPKFQCSQCESRFWLPFPESLKQKELIGFPLSWIESAPVESPEREVLGGLKQAVRKPTQSELTTKDCPRCGVVVAEQALDCDQCGIVFEKYLAKEKDQEEGVRSTLALRKMWQKILDDFENESLHESFLLECQKLNCLTYASRRYSHLEEAVGHDETIIKMKERLAAVAEQGLSNEASNGSTSKQPVSKSKRKWLRASHLTLLIAAIIVMVGFVVPGGRNLIGVGAAVAFLSLAVRLSFKS